MSNDKASDAVATALVAGKFLRAHNPDFAIAAARAAITAYEENRPHFSAQEALSDKIVAENERLRKWGEKMQRERNEEQDKYLLLLKDGRPAEKRLREVLREGVESMDPAERQRWREKARAALNPEEEG